MPLGPALLAAAQLVVAAQTPTTATTPDASWQPPVRPAIVVRPFDPPPRPWMAGHRGVDLAASAGHTLTAPADGSLRFAGQVAGKPVVTWQHTDGTLSSFEPAVAQLHVGQVAKRGQPIAVTSASSTHCVSACFHWGVRIDGRYVDPMTPPGMARIVLRPESAFNNPSHSGQ